jgi:hypothetical protein
LSLSKRLRNEQSIAHVLLAKRRWNTVIANEAAAASEPSQPPITAQDFGAGVKDVFTQKIPSLAKAGYTGTKNFFKGLFGIGN